MSSRARLPKASDVVVTALRQQILAERLDVGARLASETELMEEFGLGRVTVREALRILERDGLINIRRGAGGGNFVREVGVEQISDSLAVLLSMRDTSLLEFAEFRIHVEPPVTRLAADNATDEQRAALTQMADQLSVGAVVADFHGLVAEASGNGVHEIISASLRLTLESQVRYEAVSPQYSEDNIREHIQIARAISDGRADDAEDAMRRHLEGYRRFIVEAGLAEAPIIPRRPMPVRDAHPM